MSVLKWTCVRTRISRHALKEHSVEGPVTYDFTLQSMVRDHTYMMIWEVC